jgi:hypothetical protein
VTVNVGSSGSSYTFAVVPVQSNSSTNLCPGRCKKFKIDPPPPPGINITITGGTQPSGSTIKSTPDPNDPYQFTLRVTLLPGSPGGPYSRIYTAVDQCGSVISQYTLSGNLLPGSWIVSDNPHPDCTNINPPNNINPPCGVTDAQLPYYDCSTGELFMPPYCNICNCP